MHLVCCFLHAFFFVSQNRFGVDYAYLLKLDITTVSSSLGLTSRKKICRLLCLHRHILSRTAQKTRLFSRPVITNLGYAYRQGYEPGNLGLREKM